MSKSFDIHNPLDLSEGETRKGSRSWAITVDKDACKAIIAGKKTALAHCILPLKLELGDDIYVVEQNSGGKVVCRVTATEAARGSKEWIWEKYRRELCMRYVDYWRFFWYRQTVCVIRFDKVQEPTRRAIYIEDLGLLTSPMFLDVVKPPKKF